MGGERGMSAPEPSVRPAKLVRKAVIPAAGFGTRLFPATRAVKKELFPVIDGSGRAKPVIFAIVEEAVAAGVDEVCILVQSRDRELFEELFHSPPHIEWFTKLSEESRRYSDYLIEIGRRVTILPQEVQDGFGHAVFCARSWVGDEPFLLLLGDHLYASSDGTSCSRQVVDAFESVHRSVVALAPTPGGEVHRFGCVSAVRGGEGDLLTITGCIEKPAVEYARRRLLIEGLGNDTFLAAFGEYVLSPAIFGYLGSAIEKNLRERGEFQLTSCLDRLCREEGVYGCVVRGRRFDIGNPAAYIESLVEFSRVPPGGNGG
jgi:UTP-glucose-1-phosphate uridylyltransferase